MAQERRISPRIAALRRRLNAGEDRALDRFWDEIRGQGTPLIEPIRGDDRNVLVTFLWRTEQAANVVVMSPALPDVPRASRLRRIPDTDVWHRSYRMPADTRFTYRFSVNDPLIAPQRQTPEQEMARMTATRPDPFNPRRLDTGLVADSSMTSMPAAPAEPWSEPRAGAPRGEVREHSIRGATLDNERPVWVYTPPKYAPDGEPYGLLLLFDGQAYGAGVKAPTVLDNLLAEGAIPPLVAVLLSSIDLPTRARELPCHPPFVDFLTDELLPWVRREYNVSPDPARTIVGGASFGGLAAAYVAFRRPDVSGNALCQSGSFWWSNSDSEWLTREFARAGRVPVRFYLNAGLMENRLPPNAPEGRSSLLVANRHLRDVLEAKGYTVHYAEFNGGHDFAWVRATLADGLLALANG